MFYIHIEVARYFVGKKPIGCEVAHNNGKAGENHYRNIRYATPVENAADKIIHGTHREGETHPSAVLKAADVREILRRISENETQASVARSFNVKRATIGAIVTGRSWKTIPRDPPGDIIFHGRR